MTPPAVVAPSRRIPQCESLRRTITVPPTWPKPRFFIAPRWLADRLLCARYAHLPLANIGADAPCAMADAFYGRLLRHNRHVLWASETSRPDLGGAEGDDNDVSVVLVLCTPMRVCLLCLLRMPQPR